MKVRELYYKIREIIEEIGIDKVLEVLEIEKLRWCELHPMDLAEIITGEISKEKLLEITIRCSIANAFYWCFDKISRGEWCSSNTVREVLLEIYNELSKVYDEEYLAKQFRDACDNLYYWIKKKLEQEILKKYSKKIS